MALGVATLPPRKITSGKSISCEVTCFNKTCHLIPLSHTLVGYLVKAMAHGVNNAAKLPLCYPISKN
jgi:hypothetical protein